MFIVADIGGTKMRIAGSKDLASFTEPVIIDTPQDFETGLKLFVDAIEKICYGEEPEKVCVGLPGVLNAERTALFRAPNLRGWEKQDIKVRLEKEIGSRVFLENDSALVALGEANFGAGRQFPIMMYLTVSTGVGGARIVNKKIDQRRFGFEPGHHIVMIDGKPHELENLISGTAIEKKYGKKPYEITDENVWDYCARQVASAIYNLMLDWSPDGVVLGGSMFKEIGIKVDRVVYEMKHLPVIFPELPKIKKAELGELGGLYGGLSYLKNN
ncbi:MAG: ROK family protein [Patescibacteria group bacterium]